MAQNLHGVSTVFQPTLINILAQTQPTTWYEVGLLPTFFSIFGAILWIGGKVTEMKSGKKSYWKFLAIPLILLAIWVGIGHVMNINEMFYAMSVKGHGRKMIAMHYFALIFPVVVLLGIGIWEFLDRRAATERY